MHRCFHQCPCPALASFATVMWSDIYFGPQITVAVVLINLNKAFRRLWEMGISSRYTSYPMYPQVSTVGHNLLINIQSIWTLNILEDIWMFAIAIPQAINSKSGCYFVDDIFPAFPETPRPHTQSKVVLKHIVAPWHIIPSQFSNGSLILWPKIVHLKTWELSTPSVIN